MENSKLVKYEAIDDEDIHHYLPNAKIILYKELRTIKDIKQLLPSHKSYFVLLYPVHSDTSGHWVCLTRFNDTIEFFCSYGKKIDSQLKWCKNEQYNEKPILTQLLKQTKLKVVYNSIDFQNNKNYKVSTCGAFAVFRVLTMIEKNMDLSSNNNLLKELKKNDSTKSYDDLVCEYIDYR